METFSLLEKKRNLKEWNKYQVSIFKKIDKNSMEDIEKVLELGRIFAECCDELYRYPSLEEFKKKLGE